MDSRAETTDKNAPETTTDNSERLPSTRLSHPKNLLNVLPRVEIRPMNGRTIGTRSPAIPPMVKRIIGETAHMAGKGGGCGSTADTFDVHRNSVSRFKADTGEAKRELDREIHEKALDSIAGMFATAVSPEKLASLDVKDATRSMKDLAKVAETFGDKQKNVFNGPTIILYNPVQHTEEDYDVIDVEAREIK